MPSLMNLKSHDMDVQVRYCYNILSTTTKSCFLLPTQEGPTSWLATPLVYSKAKMMVVEKASVREPFMPAKARERDWEPKCDGSLFGL